MEIVVNEWLLDYLRPDADASETDLVDKFVKAWLEKCDKIVIRENSPFASKFYAYMYQSGGYPAYRKRFEVLFHLFLDSDRTVKVNECDIKELPQELAKIVPNDDKYLVELWYSVPGSVIVTTDSKLRNKLIEYDSFAKIYLLEEFFRTYCSGS
ncbi:MAG: hypothetical protein MUO97_11475 [Dehalococcoidia bacterium]|nr:hypothetical protein [Dehalococcoidia bacterium]